MTATHRRGLLYVAVATFFFSTAPVLIRWAADSLSAYEISGLRMAVAAAIVLAVAALKKQAPRLSRREWLKFALYGLITSLHFLLFVAAFNFTTIAHALSLTYTAPIFVTLLSALFLREPVARRKYVGIAVAVIGVAILTSFQPQFSGRMLIGDLLAVGSAICYALYSVIGRSERNRYPLMTYAAVMYSTAALWLAPAVLANLTPSGYTWPAVLSVLALGIFPLALGHTLYNAALRHTHATYVNLIATQEVTGGIILGWLLLGEMPTVNSIIGAVVTLVGIGLVLV